MNHTLVTVLTTLTIPAIALVVIVGMERSATKRREQQLASDDTGVAGFEVSARTKAFVDTGKPQPSYRKRTG
jgi:hypothetical protein